MFVCLFEKLCFFAYCDTVSRTLRATQSHTQSHTHTYYIWYTLGRFFPKPQCLNPRKQAGYKAFFNLFKKKACMHLFVSIGLFPSKRQTQRKTLNQIHIMTNTQLIEDAANRSLELTSNLGCYEKDFNCDSEAYDVAHRACRVSFQLNGQKYRVLRQKEATTSGGYGSFEKINTRYYIVKTVGKRVIKEKDSPIKLAKILEAAETAKVESLSNQDAIRETLGKVLLPF